MHSLRTRVILLALLAGVLLAAAGTSFFLLLAGTQRATLEGAQRHLGHLASELQEAYLRQVAQGADLSRMMQPEQPDPPPPPPPPPGAQPESRPAPLRRRSGASTTLSAVTASVLKGETDVQGGFYARRADTLTGFAFPTHADPGRELGPGPAPGLDLPPVEALPVEALARLAVRKGAPQSSTSRTDHDALVLVAVPIREGDAVVGAAWLLERFPGLETGRNRQLLLGGTGLAGAALLCALLTFLITSEVNAGVQTVLTRLGNMEGALGDSPQRGRTQLREFQQVLERVDALSRSLQQQIATQRTLEDEVRHRQRLSALGQFAAGVAHELRNPLATIRLRSQLSQRTADLAAVEHNSAVVLHEVDRLDAMIERLLFFARPLRLQLAPVPVATLLTDTRERWHDRCIAAGVHLACSAPHTLYALCDPSTLQQVLDNLLDNALQATATSLAEVPAILLEATPHGERIEIAVIDNGCGMDANTATHALEPFFTTRDGGTGLGLSLSYEIVQAHGGDLRLLNGVEGGVTATLTLPRAPLVASELL